MAAGLNEGIGLFTTWPELICSLEWFCTAHALIGQSLSQGAQTQFQVQFCLDENDVDLICVRSSDVTKDKDTSSRLDE